MGRPPLPVGTYGRIQVYALSWGGFRARVSTDGEITARTKVSKLAELWLRDIDESDRAIRTKFTIGMRGTDVSLRRSVSCESGTSVCLAWTEWTEWSGSDVGRRAHDTPKSYFPASSAWRSAMMRSTPIRCAS